MEDFLPNLALSIFAIFFFFFIIQFLYSTYPYTATYLGSKLFFDSLSESVVTLIVPISLIIVGLLVERQYVGRISIFSNSIAINIHLYAIKTTNLLLITYGNIALIFGAIAIFAYATWVFYDNDWIEDYLVLSGTGFYTLSLLFSSIIAGLVILFTA